MVVLNQNPQLQVQQAILEAPAFHIQAAVIGDPLGKVGISSGGPGLNGIGHDPRGEGIGDLPGSGSGGPITPGRSVTRITRGPELLHKEEPEYSEEARKARFQGKVILAIEVGLDGRAINIRVVESAGFGLDEKAMESVQRWKFRPALSGNRLVAAPAIVEVTFHLL